MLTWQIATSSLAGGDGVRTSLSSWMVGDHVVVSSPLDVARVGERLGKAIDLLADRHVR